MKKIIMSLIIFLLVFEGNLFLQNKKYNKELPLLSITNQQFDTLISDAVCSLKKCDYYSKAIVFSVTIGKKNDSLYVDLIANPNQQVVLMNSHKNPLGYFFNNQHLFFVFCDTLPNIFKKTKTKKIFIINDTQDFWFVADFTEWLYLYHNDRFSLKEVIGPCD
jgi:hypothetical protein